MVYTTLRCFATVLILFTNRASAVYADYFWRDYNGTIPSDAVVGGQSFGHSVYIGQAYIKNEGFMVVQINPGVKEVAVPIKGVRRVDTYIKILCGAQNFFEWIPTNNTQLHTTLLDTHAVIGGHEDNHGYIYIGRVNIGDGTHIGKVNAFELGNANFRYPEKNIEQQSGSYEVLCYVDYGATFDIRSTLVTTKEQ